MDFSEAKNEIQHLLSRVKARDLPRLIDWMKNSDELDEALVDNQRVILDSIAEDLRSCLPVEAMLSSETRAVQKTQQKPQPTVHVDAFLYDEETVDALCEEGRMSRNYCLSCGSQHTAALDFISHSFSVPELHFLFQHVLPDLTGRLVVDVGSRLGAVLYGGHLYSSAARLVGVEISEEFVRLQTMAVQKYGFSDRIQEHGNMMGNALTIFSRVRQEDTYQFPLYVCTQEALVKEADVLIMNNVFEYFMEPSDQIKSWKFIISHFRKKGALLVTVPSIQESLSILQGEVMNPGQWVEEVPLNYDVYMGKDTDADALREIHLYRVL